MRASSSHWPKLVPSSNGTHRLGSATSKCRPRSREPQLADDQLVEQADDVGARADDVARVAERPLERAGAAEPLAALEHEDRLAGAGEVRGAREAVVAAADDHGVPVAGGELGDGRGQADLAQLLRDGVHAAGSLAMASTTTAPCAWTRTGLHSIRSTSSVVSCGREARGGGKVGAGEQRGAAEVVEGVLDAFGRGGEREDGDVVEHLRVGAAEADRAARGPRRRGGPPRSARRRAAPSARPGRRRSPLRRRQAARTSASALTSSASADAALCSSPAAERLTATGPPSSASAATASSSPAATRPGTTGTPAARSSALASCSAEPARGRTLSAANEARV